MYVAPLSATSDIYMYVVWLFLRAVNPVSIPTFRAEALVKPLGSTQLRIGYQPYRPPSVVAWKLFKAHVKHDAQYVRDAVRRDLMFNFNTSHTGEHVSNST